MKRFVLATAILLLSTQTYADVLSELTTRARQVNSISGNFAQSRHIAVLRVPLQSSGNFQYLRAQGLRWHSIQPVESTLQISTNQGIRVLNAQGESQTLAAPEILSQLFLGLFSGELSALQDIFTITEQTVEHGWQLRLSPRSTALKQHLLYIDISGTELVETVLIADANGDRNAISLLNQVVEKSAE